MRELLEETGYRVSSDSIKKLGSVMPNSAILTSVIDVFLAYVIKEQSSPSLSEVDGLIKVPVDKVSFMVSNGQITDSFTLSALALFWSSPERESFKS
jgi:ADP-ribose pyrophosphatase